MTSRWKIAAFAFLGVFLILLIGQYVSIDLEPDSAAGLFARLFVAAVVAAAGVAVLVLGYGRRSSRIRAMHELALRMSRPHELQPILESGLAHAVRVAGCTGGCVHRIETSGELVLAAGVLPAGVRLRERPSAQVAEHLAALTKAEPVSLRPGPLTYPWAALFGDELAVPVVLVPLVSADTPHGILTVVCRGKQTLGGEDLEALRAIGAQLGAALANARLYEKLLRDTRTDPLTGLGSRRHFEDVYRRELARSSRHHRPLSLAMVDVDRFKEINDQHGHGVGDRVLAAVGRLMQDVRAGDFAARYGGDEFVVLMPDTNLDRAYHVVDRIKERLAALNAERFFPFPIELSIGVAELDPDAGDLFEEADAAMYRDKHGKAAGRTAPERPTPGGVAGGGKSSR